MKYIYTIGNCSKVSHAEAKEWRDRIRYYFDTYSDEKVKVINITDYYSYEEELHETDKEIADFCERSIKKSECVIVNNDKLDTSGGSQREIGLARAYGVPIFIINKDNYEDIYPWDLYWAERIFNGEDSLSFCCDHVLNYIVNA